MRCELLEETVAAQPVGDHRRRRRAAPAGLALAGAVAAATMAVAPVVSADTLARVRSHVHGADVALHQVVIAAGSGRSLTSPLASLEAEIRAAGQDSTRLYRSAHRPHSAARARAATALTKLAAQDSRDAAVLTPLLPRLGSGQGDVAVFIASVTQGREQTLSLAVQLIRKLPATLAPTMADTVGQLSNAGAGQVGALAAAMAPGSIACPAIDGVAEVLATVLTSVPSDLTRVQSLLPLLPPATQARYTAIIAGLPTQLNLLLASLGPALNCPRATPIRGLTAGTGSIVSVVGTAGSVVDSIAQLAQSLVKSFVPGIGTGQPPAPVTVTAPVSGLLHQVTSLIPGLGSLFGADSSSGQPGLGGLPGPNL